MRGAQAQYAASIALMVIALIAANLLLVQQVIGLPVESSRWLSEVIAVKLRQAKQMHSPKVVVSGGSSVLFGIKAGLIASQTGLDAINLGTHAGLGLHYILYLCKRVASPGDIVILIPEYELYNEGGSPSRQLVDYALAHDREYLDSLGALRRFRFLMSARLDYLIGSLRGRGRHSAWDDVAGCYQSSAIDAYGDETCNAGPGRASREKLQASELTDMPFAYFANGLVVSRQSAALLREFSQWCRQNRVTVVASYPSTLRLADYEKPEAQQLFQQIQRLYQELDVPVLGQPQDSQYDLTSFFDTIYHLDDRAARRRTAGLIEFLKPFLPAAGRERRRSPGVATLALRSASSTSACSKPAVS